MTFLHVAENGALLGDSAYGLSATMLTPFRKPKTQKETKFNNAQMQTRVLVENTIGILKAR